MDGDRFRHLDMGQEIGGPEKSGDKEKDKRPDVVVVEVAKPRYKPLMEDVRELMKIMMAKTSVASYSDTLFCNDYESWMMNPHPGYGRTWGEFRRYLRDRDKVTV